MSSTAHGYDSKYMPEHNDASSVFERKATLLAKWLAESKHAIFYTGAGISTSAGIPDFRGPDGVWTLKAQRRKRKKKACSSLRAIPTTTHMSIVALQKAGILKYVVSQNCDGLHMRSGLPRNALSELHGNVNLERCEKCGKEILRDYRTRRSGNGCFNHETGRTCPVRKCSGRLMDSIVNFGEDLPILPLEYGFHHAENADLCVVFGSSCTVTPAADIPRTVGQTPGMKLVICNLQKTPLNGLASLVLHSKCDKIMKFVMAKLGLAIPKWELHRRIVFSWKKLRTPGKKQAGKSPSVRGGRGRGHGRGRAGPTPTRGRGNLLLTVRGVEVDDGTTPHQVLKSVKLETPADPDSPSLGTSTKSPHAFRGVPLSRHASSAGDSVLATLGFYRRYKEPPFGVVVERPEMAPGQTLARVHVHLFYDPSRRSWRVKESDLARRSGDSVEKVQAAVAVAGPRAEALRQ